MIADSGYKTPAIAHYLLERNIIPVFHYTRPKGVKENLRLLILLMMQTMTVISIQRSKYEPIAPRPEKVTENIRVIPKYVSPVPYYLFVQKVKTSKT